MTRGGGTGDGDAPAFAELGARSNFTFLDGASHPEELVEAAADLGLAAIGIADRNSFAGLVRAHLATREAGIAFVPGCRVLLADDGAEYLAWPTDRAAYGRLARLLSQGRMAAPKGGCRLAREDLIDHAAGLVLAAVPPPGAPDDAFAARLRRDADALRPALALPLHLAADHRLRRGDQARLDALAAIAAAARAPLLATGGVRYHHPARRRLADVLAAIRLGTTVDALGDAAEPNAEAHLKPPAAVARLFARHPDALAATLRVADACRGFSLDQLRYEYPEEALEPGRTAQETLAARVAAAAAERWPAGVPDGVRARLDHELALIGRLGYAPYFLTVHEVVRFARSRGILYQGRGSAANSTVCYVLGITAVDPERHDLLFERFVSASRGEPPDIDIDFEHERREEVIQWIYDRYGRERAALCATVIRYRTRSAVREVGRALGLSEDVTAKLAKGSWGPGGERTLAEVAEGEGLDPGAEPRLRLALELAEELQGFPRHLATHVGGFVITRGPLVELAVVTNVAMAGRTTIEWDKDDIEALGILKVDVLGLGMLTCLRCAFELLRAHARRDLDLAALPKDCAETYAMLRRADSLGVFQVESRAQMAMLPRLKPREFYDLVIQVAIVRPGPIQGDMVHPYLRRRAGLEEATYPAPAPEHGPPDELERVLGKTLGVPLFQEQAMRLAVVAAGYTPDEADALRRAMATFRAAGRVARHRARFVGGMAARGYDRGFAERCFAQVEGFGSYGFPESHAAAFAHLAYASAWVKRHHPAAFAAALLNSQPMGFYAPAQIVRDAKEHGVVVRPVDANASEWDCTLEPDAASAGGLALRLGLRLAAGLAEADGRAVAAARRAGNGAPFAAVGEVAARAGVGRRALEALAAADAFAAALGGGRCGALWGARGVERTADELPLFATNTAMAAAGGGGEASPLLAPEPAPDLPPEREGEAVVEDYRATGLTLRAHPLALLRPVLDALGGLADTRRLAAAPAGSWLRLPGLVLIRQRPGTAKGIVFVTVEDEWGIANLVVYPDVAARHRAALVGARLLLAEGRVEREAAPHAEVPIVHLIVRRLIDRSDLLDGLAEMECGDRGAWGERASGRADEARRPEPGARLPPSRDFR